MCLFQADYLGPRNNMFGVIDFVICVCVNVYYIYLYGTNGTVLCRCILT